MMGKAGDKQPVRYGDRSTNTANQASPSFRKQGLRNFFALLSITLSPPGGETLTEKFSRACMPFCISIPILHCGDSRVRDIRYPNCQRAFSI